MQLQIVNSPFNQEQVELINRLVPSLTHDQKLWLSGFLANLEASQTDTAVLQLEQTLDTELTMKATTSTATREVTILYGTDTGNSQGLAEQFADTLDQQNIKVSVSDMDDFKPKSIKKVQDLLIVTSTDGDGVPPDNALAFYEFLHSERAPKLENVRFSILALGDTSYDFFCQTGKDFDKILETLGAERLYPRVDCDLDFEELAEDWFSNILKTLSETKNGETGSDVLPSSPIHSKTSQTTYSKKHPFRAEILESINLNDHGSNKETIHLELDLEDSNLTFQPGDSLGIIPENDPTLVDQLIKEMEWDPTESVPINKNGDLLSLYGALTVHFDITTLTKPLLEKATTLSDNEELQHLVESDDRDKINAYMYGRDVLDLVRDFGPWKATTLDFLNILRKLPVRLYSIASSLKANPDEVHLTIGTVRYHSHGRDRLGVCSGQITERTGIGDQLSVFVQRNDNFRLPENPTTPIIMIGAGTGVAPYRSFLEEREEINAEGDTWLFFGEQHLLTDFLYQTEWKSWLKNGVLTRMDVAFSRDTDEKVYVQHRLFEKRKTVYEWLEKGAHVYVCGDEKHMAKDVHQTLLTIIEKEGNKSVEEAEAYIKAMRKEKRYQRDVY